ncbi:hypothetical protein Tco_1391946 [Tanacetum coccineum]
MVRVSISNIQLGLVPATFGLFSRKFMYRFSSINLVLVLNTLNALLLIEYPTKNPSSDFHQTYLGNQTNGIAGTRDNIVAGQAEKKIEPEQEYILIPFCTTDPLISQVPKDSEEDVGMSLQKDA